MTVTLPLVASGLVGGLVATIAMTVLMVALGDDSPPPTAALYAKYVGDGPPEEYLPQGMALHFLYGIGGGGALAVLAGLLFPSVGIGGTVLAGLAFGVVLMVVGMGFWMRTVLGVRPGRSEVAAFGLFHVVYGVVLGGALGVVPGLF